MPVNTSKTEICTQTYEVLLDYNECLSLFTDAGITVPDSQIFNILVQRTNGQEIAMGTVGTDGTVVLRFTQVVGPTDI